MRALKRLTLQLAERPGFLSDSDNKSTAGLSGQGWLLLRQYQLLILRAASDVSFLPCHSRAAGVGCQVGPLRVVQRIPNLQRSQAAEVGYCCFT